MTRAGDVTARLERALALSAADARCGVRLVRATRTAWASATFIGARHRVVLEGVPSATLDAWLDALPEADFTLHGHLLADLTVAGVDRHGDSATIVLEALTVEERMVA